MCSPPQCIFLRSDSKKMSEICNLRQTKTFHKEDENDSLQYIYIVASRSIYLSYSDHICLILFIYIYIYIYIWGCARACVCVCVCINLSNSIIIGSYILICHNLYISIYINLSYLFISIYLYIYIYRIEFSSKRSNRVAISVYCKSLHIGIEVSVAVKRMYVNNSNCVS